MHTLQADSQIIAGECGVIDVALKEMSIHINNASICGQGSSLLWINTFNSIRFANIILKSFDR